jgi:hypothetical protein
MKAEIKKIEEIYDEIQANIKYQVVIWLEDLPNLKLGKVEVLQ